MSKSGAPFFPTTLPIGTIGDLLAGCAAMLESEGVAEPQREAREIVAAVLDVPKFWAAANAVADASPQVARSVIRAAMKRAGGMPLAYAVGRASFRHLTLEVDERVLIPRVETEVLVERVLERCTPKTRTIADIGTGSGAIALSLAFERAFERVIATDVSLDAINVATANAASLSKGLQSPVVFRHGSLLAPLARRETRRDRLQSAVHQLCRDRRAARRCPRLGAEPGAAVPARRTVGHARADSRRRRTRSHAVDCSRSRSIPSAREPSQR